MKKRKRIIRKFEYVLNQEEARMVRQCLNYCWHRLTKHENSGIQGLVDPAAVDLLRDEF